MTTKGLTFGHQEFAFDVDEEAGNLALRERFNSVSVGIVGYYREKYTISLELPKGVGLIVKGDDGHYSITNLAGAISLKLSDAHVVLTGCTGNSTFDIHHQDGRVITEGGFRVVEKSDDDMRLTLASGKANVSIRADDPYVKLFSK